MLAHGLLILLLVVVVAAAVVVVMFKLNSRGWLRLSHVMSVKVNNCIASQAWNDGIFNDVALAS